MRILNRAHVPWFLFVCFATVVACVLYIANFHPERLPFPLPLPAFFGETPPAHHTIGGTPLGLIFGATSLAIFVFAALLGMRKKVALWRIGTVQRWLRAHIWLTLLTIPLVLLHSGFRLGGPMTMLLMALYAIVMVSGIYGLVLQHHLPRLMKERLPAETVFEQIPHIRAQLFAAAEKMRDVLKPTPPKKTDAAAPAATPSKSVTATSAAMASTAPAVSTPAARAKTTVGSSTTAETVTGPTPVAQPAKTPAPPSVVSSAAASAPKAPETIGTPTARVQAEPAAGAVPREAVPAGDQAAPAPPTVAAAASTPGPAAVVAKPSPPPRPTPAAKAPTFAPDPVSEATLVAFIEETVLPYLAARRGDKFRLHDRRFSDDTFRFIKLRVAETYRSRVEEVQAWCDERRMLDLQARLQHWLHGWLFVHVPISFLLLIMTFWHAWVTLFRY
ncbi:MAG: hypothetical protein ABI795_06465 [Chthoniobacterales bacterium]